MLLSIVIPCYNEINTLDILLKNVESLVLPNDWKKEIIIVDDSSTDGSKELLEKLIGNFKIIFRNKNGGKGAALKEGFKNCTGDFIIIQDADLECDPNDIPNLLLPIINKKSEVVLGVRKHPEEKRYLSYLNFYGGLALTKIYNNLFGKNLQDMASCYKIFPKKVLNDVIKLPYNDFRYDVVHLTHYLASAGNFIEVPVSYNLRGKKEGKKMNYKAGAKCFIEILKLKFR